MIKVVDVLDRFHHILDDVGVAGQSVRVLVKLVLICGTLMLQKVRGWSWMKLNAAVECDVDEVLKQKLSGGVVYGIEAQCALLGELAVVD